MRLLLSLLALVGLAAACVPSCINPDTLNNTQEFRDERKKVFECLFELTDVIDHDGRVSQKEFEKLTHDHLDVVTRNTIVTWKVYSYFCSCTCRDTIGWDDINGTEDWCLYTLDQVRRAYARMCTK